jgi:hypothetical protein
VLAPLAVACGLNEPHDPLGVQLQVTPLLAESLDTVAATLAVWLITIEDGGGVLKVTEMGTTMLTLAVAFLVESVTEVAVIVTVAPGDCGAV